MRFLWLRMAGVFLAGFFLGSFLTWWTRPFPFQRWPQNPEKHYQHILNRFDRELKLTPEQRKKVEEILTSRREKLKAIHQEAALRSEELFKSARFEINAILTPQQQEKFEQMHKRWEKRKARQGFWEKPHP